MSDISFLPSSFKDKEEEIIKESIHEPEDAGSISMHVPESEEEDVEIIEVDASEVDQVLVGEPLYSKLYFKASLWIDGFKQKYLQPRAAEPPPKEPPQFFKAPPIKPAEKGKIPAEAAPGPGVKAPATVTAKEASKTPAAVSAQPAAKPKVRIIPSGATPRRRVRIIKRVRKPVHVSLLDEEMMRQMHINIPRRQFTLIFLTILFAAVFVGSYFLLENAKTSAAAEQQTVQSALNDVKNLSRSELEKWMSYQDLEPRLIALGNLMDEHKSVLKVLAFLEKNTLKDVSYGSFSKDSDNQVNLAVTAGSIESAARQLLVFEEAPEIQTLEANSFSISTDEQAQSKKVTFQLLLEFTPDALKYASTGTGP
ncbi:MAG: hypothetical protein ACOYUZ_06530 [Patescibacteria group bacterium]